MVIMSGLCTSVLRELCRRNMLGQPGSIVWAAGVQVLSLHLKKFDWKIVKTLLILFNETEL